MRSNPLLVLAVAVLGLVLAVAGPVMADKIGSWEQTPHDATGAMLVKTQDGYRFHCTVENVRQDGADVIASTARHCVYHDEETDFFGDHTDAGWDYLPIGITYADDESGLLYEADPIAISSVDDLALIRVKGAGQRAIVPIGDSDKLQVGEVTVNYGYPLDFGKLRNIITILAPRLPHLPEQITSNYPQWSHGIVIEGNINPGQSGSGIYDQHTHALVGVLVGLTGNIMGIAEPSNRLVRLLNGRDATAYVAPKLETTK